MLSLRALVCVALCGGVVGLAATAVRAEDVSPDFTIADPVEPLPAVDGINGKLTGFGGVADETGIFGGAGSLSVPLGTRSGLQIDGLLSAFDSRLQSVTTAGAAAHLFRRDPAVGLVGVYGDYLYADIFNGTHVYSVAAEGALYLGRFDLEAVAGAQSGAVDAGPLGTYGMDWHFFDVALLSYYPTDNLRLTVGHSYVLEEHAALLGAEWGFPVASGAMGALFANGSVSDGGSAVIAGINVYFGRRDKTLIQRHREDDPPNYLDHTVHCFSCYGHLRTVVHPHPVQPVQRILLPGSLEEVAGEILRNVKNAIADNPSHQRKANERRLIEMASSVCPKEILQEAFASGDPSMLEQCGY